MTLHPLVEIARGTRGSPAADVVAALSTARFRCKEITKDISPAITALIGSHSASNISLHAWCGDKTHTSFLEISALDAKEVDKSIAIESNRNVSRSIHMGILRPLSVFYYTQCNSSTFFTAICCMHAHKHVTHLRQQPTHFSGAKSSMWVPFLSCCTFLHHKEKNTLHSHKVSPVIFTALLGHVHRCFSPCCNFFLMDTESNSVNCGRFKN